MPPSGAPRPVVLVPHTHWDRGWYLSLDAFRVRFAPLVDRLIDMIESNDAYAVFTFDGQTALLDDYLSVRPERMERLKRLATRGRVSVGPWTTLPDVMLAGDEAIVRNLQNGLRRARAFGRTLEAGYVPDSFGHFAQLPQILSQLGLKDFLFMRGLPLTERDRLRSIFDWRAPDGSSVRATHMVLGYLAGSGLGHDTDWGRLDGSTATAERADEKLRATVEALAQRQDEAPLLVPVGCDHMPPDADLPRIVAELQKLHPELELTIGGYEDYLRRLDAHRERPTYTGDLLGRADHPILSNVASSRMYLKQQNYAAQSALLRRVEVLAAWDAVQTAPATYDASIVDHAWNVLFANHAHDDICGCSVDAVHRDDEQRFGAVLSSSDELTRTHLERYGARFADGTTRVAVWNPEPRARRQRVRARVLVPNPDGEQAPPRPARPLVARDAAGRTQAVHVRRTTAPDVRSRYLETTWGRNYEIEFEAEAAGLGWSIYDIIEQTDATPLASAATVAPATHLENDLYRLEATPHGLQVTHKGSGHRATEALSFTYDMDAGDLYSFSPVLGFREIRAGLETIESRDAHELRFVSRLRVPAGLSEEPPPVSAAKATPAPAAVEMAIDVRVTLPGPQAAPTFEITYTNTARNGRLRALFAPKIGEATASNAENPFRVAVHERPTDLDFSPQKPAYPGEREYPTHFQGTVAWIAPNGSQLSAWIANRGLPEYELVERGCALAVTLHRAVGRLSVNGGGIRACQAGPAVETPEGQMLGRTQRLALAIGFEASSDAGKILDASRRFASPLEAWEVPYLARRAQPLSGATGEGLLDIADPNVRFSALKPLEDRRFALRVWNAVGRDVSTTLQLHPRVHRLAKASLTELWPANGAQPVAGSTSVTLKPFELATYLLEIAP